MDKLVTPEHVKAQQWRERMGLTRPQLAELSGYSYEAIYWFEQGRRPEGRPHSDYAWRRYLLCCSGVERQLIDGYIWGWE